MLLKTEKKKKKKKKKKDKINRGGGPLFFPFVLFGPRSPHIFHVFFFFGQKEPETAI
jgi:hypothetical protein